MEKRSAMKGSHPGFGREARLRNRRQLDLMKASGRRSAGGYCVVVGLEEPPDGQRRAAFLISRRYSHLAVVRNRARRLFREAYRRLYPELTDCWMVMIPRHRMQSDVKMDLVYEEIRGHCRRLGLFRPPVAGQEAP